MKMISVIIPVYNTEEFLSDCIKSVLNQTYSNLEILIINDNSHKTCKELINDLSARDKRISVFHFDERKGVGAARNYGVYKSTGDYVYFLDSDDYLEEDTLQELIQNINGHDWISGKLMKSHLSADSSDNVDENDNMEKVHIDESIIVYEEFSKFKLIKNKSALNRLFKKSFVIDNNLYFSENVERYSDLAFMIPAILNTKDIPCAQKSMYYKRRRNDPITNPALMQTGIEDRINDFCYIYHILKEQYKDDFTQTYLDNQLLNLYRGAIVKFFKKNENVDNVFRTLVDATNKIASNVLKKRSYMIRKEIKVLQQGNIAKYKKVNLFHHRKRKIKSAFRSKRRFLLQMYRMVILKLPLQENTIVFESFLGKSYSDSPKYIYEYMIDNKMNFKYVWIFNEKKKIPGNAIQVKRFSLRYYYYLARAKYWVSNSRLPKSINKREETVYLQTWHGTPLKSLVFDMKDIHSADPKYKINFFQQSRRWNYLSSPNAYSSEIFIRAFKYEKELLEFGYPRNDILYRKNNKNDIEKMKNQMNIPSDKKVILYAPTWRDDEYMERGKYSFSLKLDLDRMQKEIGNEYIILLRTHYFIANEIDVSQYGGFVYDFSKYDDIAELYLVSDILITDYSSVFFDYANLRRPILFYTYDLEKYRDTLRGFYFDIENEVPGPLLRTSEDVIESIKDIDQISENYQLRYEDFYNKFCDWDNGYATEKTVKAVFKD
ncbi:CDP-glycerol glycerophosphotransferase family protein [Ornithinibacillus salinisoli]|uniref:CDP-glycerol glycerophosphotransferase family protein n=1 Tax=Ornithinibacillus salinisoli TaxID=1848459 RepID=A0ABW4W1F1_9BACI